MIRLMTEKIRLMIRYEGITVFEMAKRCAEDESLKKLDFAAELGRCCREDREFFLSWKDAADKSRGILTDSDYSLLIRIGCVLGTTDCEGQLSALSGILAQIDSAVVDAEEQYKAKGRLYHSLGAIAGAAIAVIVI